MRKTVNISLTKELKKEVDDVVESGKYSSRSEFFRDLIRLWKDDKILEDVRISKKQFKEGKGSDSLEELENI